MRPVSHTRIAGFGTTMLLSAWFTERIESSSNPSIIGIFQVLGTWYNNLPVE
jgi:hypothetical protein